MSAIDRILLTAAYTSLLVVLGGFIMERLKSEGAFNWNRKRKRKKIYSPRNDPKPWYNPQFDPKMIPTLKWSPPLFTWTPKWSQINSCNRMVFHHGIITSPLQRIRSWVAFNISELCDFLGLLSSNCLYVYLCIFDVRLKFWKVLKHHS